MIYTWKQIQDMDDPRVKRIALVDAEVLLLKAGFCDPEWNEDPDPAEAIGYIDKEIHMRFCGNGNLTGYNSKRLMGLTELRKKQEEEAIKRMEILNINPFVINDFEDGVTMFLSNDLHTLDDRRKVIPLYKKEGLLKTVAYLEYYWLKKVYHVIATWTDDGWVYSYLFTGEAEASYENDKAKLKEGKTWAFVENPKTGRTGFRNIELESLNGGLRVTWFEED